MLPVHQNPATFESQTLRSKLGFPLDVDFLQSKLPARLDCAVVTDPIAAVSSCAGFIFRILTLSRRLEQSSLHGKRGPKRSYISGRRKRLHRRWNLICDSVGKFGGWNCPISGEVFYAALEPEVDVLLLGRGY